MSNKNNLKTLNSSRLQQLRAATGSTWDGVAKELDVKRAMIFHVLAGRRGFSDKTLSLLRQAEVKAGLRSQASVLMEERFNSTEIVTLLLNDASHVHPVVTNKDIQAGKKLVSVDYRTKSVPHGFPEKILVIGAKNADVWKLIGINSSVSDPYKLLSGCIPVLSEQPNLLDALTPRSYMEVMHAALDLTFGLNWRDRLHNV